MLKDYQPQQNFNLSNSMPNYGSYYKGPVPASDISKHHNYVLLTFVLIAAMVTSLVFFKQINKENTGTFEDQIQKSNDAPPAFPTEDNNQASHSQAVETSNSENDVPPPLPGLQ